MALTFNNAHVFCIGQCCAPPKSEQQLAAFTKNDDGKANDARYGWFVHSNYYINPLLSS